jgi:tRNA modification GTPase
MEHQPTHRDGGRQSTPLARDTIVASATAAGRGGVGVVRVSGATGMADEHGAAGTGTSVREIARQLLGRVPEPRHALRAVFRDGDGSAFDDGLALYFPAPHSYTGEDVLELHGHGNPLVQDALIKRIVALGARLAMPGEFTQRAFLNDKLDLAQAEAVADLISAGSVTAARAAMRSLQGEFSARVHELVAALTRLRVYLEAAIDFPEEEIDFLSTPELARRTDEVRVLLVGIESAAQQGRVLTEGATVVIAGRPNAGKSTLMNRLAGYDAAIVTPIAGTTRDLLRERIEIDGLPITLIDTAGLRDLAATHDAIEIEGMRRARAEIKRADRVLFVIDGASDPLGRAYEEERTQLPLGVPVTLVYNKLDLAQARGVLGARQGPAPTGDAAIDVLWIAASNGEGVDGLRARLKQALGYQADGVGALSARARHVAALQQAHHCFDRAVQLLNHKQGELVAEELRQAQQALGAITGEFGSDELLGEIFGSFCIGK